MCPSTGRSCACEARPPCSSWRGSQRNRRTSTVSSGSSSPPPRERLPCPGRSSRRLLREPTSSGTRRNPRDRDEVVGLGTEEWVRAEADGHHKVLVVDDDADW